MALRRTPRHTGCSGRSAWAQTVGAMPPYTAKPLPTAWRRRVVFLVSTNPALRIGTTAPRVSAQANAAKGRAPRVSQCTAAAEDAQRSAHQAGIKVKWCVPHNDNTAARRMRRVDQVVPFARHGRGRDGKYGRRLRSQPSVAVRPTLHDIRTGVPTDGEITGIKPFNCQRAR